MKMLFRYPLMISWRFEDARRTGIIEVSHSPRASPPRCGPPKMTMSSHAAGRRADIIVARAARGAQRNKMRAKR